MEVETFLVCFECYVVSLLYVGLLVLLYICGFCPQFSPGLAWVWVVCSCIVLVYQKAFRCRWTLVAAALEKTPQVN